MKQRNATSMSGLARAAALAASVLVLPAGTAHAQNGDSGRSAPSSGAFRRQMMNANGFAFNHRLGGPAPGGPGNILEPYLPPGVTQTFPLAPTDNPHILRNLLQMRATSPRPNQFLGGTLNPQYRDSGYPAPDVIIFGAPYDYGYGSGYPPVVYPYDPYSYVPGPFSPGGASIYGAYGGAFGGVYGQAGQNRVVVQREIIYVNPEARGGSRNEARSEAKPEAKTDPKPEEAAGDYYLSRSKSESLQDALDDIRRAWLNGDYARFRARIREDGKVGIFLKGKYEYSVAGDEFAQMTRDAMKRIDTTGFDLGRVTRSDDGHALASGKHTYLDPDKNKREVYVSYRLVRDGGQWKITEAGSASTPISKHEE